MMSIHGQIQDVWEGESFLEHMGIQGQQYQQAGGSGQGIPFQQQQYIGAYPPNQAMVAVQGQPHHSMSGMITPSYQHIPLNGQAGMANTVGMVPVPVPQPYSQQMQYNAQYAMQMQQLHQIVSEPLPERKSFQKSKKVTSSNGVQMENGVNSTEKNSSDQNGVWETSEKSDNNLERTKTVASNVSDVEQKKIIRSKSDVTWLDRAESPKSVTQGGGSVGFSLNTLNPDAKDFVPNKSNEIATIRNYQRYQNGQQTQRYQFRGRSGRGYGRDNMNWRNNRSSYSNKYNVKQTSQDPHQMARQRVKQCVNKVRDLLDDFANEHQLDAFYPDAEDSTDYFDELTTLSTSMLEEIDQIIAKVSFE
eukprot:TRINITY_DN7034_c1_g2_i1.p1 TRINITY_DN7034_c1_g2~~TRINITY_DN7034_c1_g2_i1.p1  ORF type:complete len:361 (-),score=30.76 TRINITY_DN7034_c1_g2_i1:355-1437(-)